MKKKVVLIFLLFFIITCIPFVNFSKVRAENLSDSIEEQLGNLDLSEMEEFTKGLNSDDNKSFIDIVYQIIRGEYSSDFSNIKEYFINLFLKDVNEFLPILFTIVAISVFCALIQNAKSIFASESVSNIIFLVCFLTVILLLSGHFISLWQNAKETLENISKTNEIMSPIILTLMIASGGNVSAGIYKPAVAFFSNGVINVLLYVCLPIISLITIFGIISNFSSNFKLKKFVDFFSGLIKWIIGIIVAIYGIFISIQGVSGAIHDGISIKAAKYAISNSIPLVGGFLRDGFDLVIAGSVLIKNSVGVASIVILFFYVLSPVIKIAVFGLMLKLVAAVTESISDSKISDLCTCVAKSVSYLNVLILLCGFMMFMSILLMIFSANAFF